MRIRRREGDFVLLEFEMIVGGLSLGGWVDYKDRRNNRTALYSIARFVISNQPLFAIDYSQHNFLRSSTKSWE
jgi:hypothetical protein